MNNNELAVYALIAIAALAVGYMLAANFAPIPGAGGNLNGTGLSNSTGAAKSVQAPADRVAKLKSTIETYIDVQFGQKTTLTYNGAEDNGEYVMMNFTDETGRPIPIPVSRDYKYMYGSAVEIDTFYAQVQLLANSANATNNTNPPPVETPKSDKPNVELFVMSYCPYGVQMEKAIIPVQELLGSKANITIKFVNYILHGAKETQENARQYCIMQNNPDKYWAYLKCFAGEGNASACMANVSINETEVDSCMNSTYSAFGISDSGTSFPIHNAENTQYGVRGSPTLVINGNVVSVNRSPEDVKNAICAAFNTAPSERSTVRAMTMSSPAGTPFPDTSPIATRTIPSSPSIRS